jgi:glutamine amidotransferase
MIGIIDYGMGNLKSVTNAFRSLGCESFIASAPNELDRADRVVLPGVGAFEGAIEALRRQGWVKKIKSEIDSGKPFLGICLGMQLLFETSEENGAHRGLEILPGKVTRIPEKQGDEAIKIPHIGWNRLDFHKKSDIFDESRDADRDTYVYFVHSYHVETDPEYVSASTFYGTDLTAAVERDNVYAVQFHPEKSGTQGIEMLRKFAALEWEPRKARRKAIYEREPAFGGWAFDSFPRH